MCEREREGEGERAPEICKGVPRVMQAWEETTEDQWKKPWRAVGWTIPETHAGLDIICVFINQGRKTQ